MKYFAKTDFGKVRQVNQDYIIAEDRKIGIFQNLFIVADGVGSNKESSFASKHCSDFVLEQLSLSKDTNDYREEFEKAYRLANTDLVYRIMANPSYKGMGTTMVSATIKENNALIVNVGDSRCYHINKDIIKQITVDHSIAEELVKENAIERDTPKYLEYKSQLSRAFGASKKIEPDFFDITLKVDDYILLCSDGLTNMVSNEIIHEIVTNVDYNLETKVSKLIETANENGGKDNIAVILIYIDDIPDDSIYVESRNIKEILNQRIAIIDDNFKSRSRRKTDGDTK